jgi:circadian clock protein KaiB
VPDDVPVSSTRDFEEALSHPPQPEYVLELYVTGQNLQSRRAIANVRKICEDYLPDRYDLKVIDLYERPVVAREGEIIAGPTLIRRLPLPLCRIVGDMSRQEHILVGLDLLK